MGISIFWLRRDLRFEDNTGLYYALNNNEQVLPLFIFDKGILDTLARNDARVSFIYDKLESLNQQLRHWGSSLLCKHGNPLDVWKGLITEFDITHVYTNKDYEPYALKRDREIEHFLNDYNIGFHAFKDHVIFEENEVLKDDNTPYTVFTPYKNKWLGRIEKNSFPPLDIKTSNFLKQKFEFPSLKSIGFAPSNIAVPNYDLDAVPHYDETRNFPGKNTSMLGTHLRFGTVSIRQVYNKARNLNQTFVSELIWREFFMQILFHFPRVVDQNFKKQYDGIQWRNNEVEFGKWCNGETGYPLVDAGMRQLNQSGFMHNRVRMVTASFLCKHLLIDWRWGESYFAEKLLDYELSSNNGNWQWAAGTGCDAAPYFRVFNPTEQLRKFDNNLEYVKKWVPEHETFSYPPPMVDHKMARERAISAYKEGLKKTH